MLLLGLGLVAELIYATLNKDKNPSVSIISIDIPS